MSRKRVDASQPAKALVEASAAERIAGIVKRHHRIVLRSLRRFGVPAGDADDGCQRVFLVTYRRLANIAHDSERAFLLQTALRVAAASRRSRARRREDDGEELAELADRSAGVEELLDRRRARGIIDRALEEMPVTLRTVFVLFEIEQLTMREIAKVLEIPQGTVASRLRCARECFRETILRMSPRAVRFLR